MQACKWGRVEGGGEGEMNVGQEGGSVCGGSGGADARNRGGQQGTTESPALPRELDTVRVGARVLARHSEPLIRDEHSAVNHPLHFVQSGGVLRLGRDGEGVALLNARREAREGAT